jgi:hypothetical protein
MCAIALDEAFGLCGNNTVIFEQIATIMGIRKTDLNSVTPLEKKYQDILLGARHDDRWVIARAWDLVVNEKIGIMDAFRQAWDEVDVGTSEPAAPAGAQPMVDGDVGEPGIDEFPLDGE